MKVGLLPADTVAATICWHYTIPVYYAILSKKILIFVGIVTLFWIFFN